jgi:type II secretory pathway pseudopilin PulG
MDLKKIQGYTLIELIAVIAMLMGLTAVMVLNGADSRHLSNLENGARQLESALSKAQAYGNSGRAFPPGTNDPKNFDAGYGVFISPNDNKKIIIYGGLGDLDNDGFEVDEDILSNTNHYTAGGQVYETITLEGSVVIDRVKGKSPASAAPQGLSVLFRRGPQPVYMYRHSNNDNFKGCEITLESGGFKKTIHVFSSGLIYIE